MTDWNQRQKRKQDVTARAALPNHMYGYCRVIHCGKPARAGTPDGLDERYCRAHADHNQRHGSPLKGSYTAKELNPYRRAALAWIVSHEDSRWVQNAIQRVKGLYQQAGPYVEAFRLRGLPPQQRAKAALARLRKHGIDPRLVVAAWLAVEMLIQDDPQPVQGTEFKRVQAAKVIHRMASGSHRRWVREVASPVWSGQKQDVIQELHVYPRSRGRVLRHLGEELESAVELLVDHHLADIHIFRREQDAAGSSGARAYPRNWVSRRRQKDDEKT
ncbi:MAG: hypothetical protein Q8O35_04195 [Humidesulfovibrio sp.]|uniref:hypothetical protein n=1 Tax=Humidesulfovibrio sp. TaxID=2910988 RepID=UPI002732C212|nr:hypothetical protein [Humidesulfovibrio sp.]MDP2847374.1 hypothetical protein [Humidesulfovibrio sp.]